jgi:hypothetical protein
MSCLARDKPGLIDHFKKTGLAKKGNAGVSAADLDAGLDARKKIGVPAFAEKDALRPLDRFAVWQETACPGSQPQC